MDDLFDLKPSRRRASNAERRAAYQVLRFILRGDCEPPRGRTLEMAWSFAHKIKVLRKNQK